MSEKNKLKLSDNSKYSLLEEMVEDGIKGGWIRAYKRNDKPSQDDIIKQMVHYVMLNIEEHFTIE